MTKRIYAFINPLQYFYICFLLITCTFIEMQCFLNHNMLRRKSIIFKHSKLNTITIRRSLSNNNNLPNFQEISNTKHFDYLNNENKIYKWWENSNYFKPINTTKNNSTKAMVIPMPPPNVTGYLHMGHALFLAIQDIITRFSRMRGLSTLWLPGTDHAGIATQLQVERYLTSIGTNRLSIGRDKFLEYAWKWKEEKGGHITEQMRSLGASADWSMEKFTLDKDMNEAVTEAFIQLHKKDLIYRGEYIINWSSLLQTAVSDLEVDYIEKHGYMYYLKYYLIPLPDETPDKSLKDTTNNDEYIVIATTRPETILGDSAICVNPSDKRYQHLIGRKVKIPLIDREIVIIGDDYVDTSFGTGALKITPSHDVNDYQIGKRHNLDFISILNKDATISSLPVIIYIFICYISIYINKY